MLENLEPSQIPAVVFVTAYDAFALRAFEVHALDYLLKPFTRARFHAAMAHAIQRFADPSGSKDDPRLGALLRELRLNRRGEGRVAITTHQGVYFLPLAEIDWIEAAGRSIRKSSAESSRRTTAFRCGGRCQTILFLVNARKGGLYFRLHINRVPSRRRTAYSP